MSDARDDACVFDGGPASLQRGGGGSRRGGAALRALGARFGDGAQLGAQFVVKGALSRWRVALHEQRRAESVALETQDVGEYRAALPLGGSRRGRVRGREYAPSTRWRVAVYENRLFRRVRAAWTVRGGLRAAQPPCKSGKRVVRRCSAYNREGRQFHSRRGVQLFLRFGSEKCRIHARPGMNLHRKRKCE